MPIHEIIRLPIKPDNFFIYNTSKKSITLILAIAALILSVGCSKQPQKEIPMEEKPKAEETIKKGDKL